MATAHALEVVGVREKGRIFLPRGASQAKVSALLSYAKAVALEFVDGDDCVLAEAAAGKYARDTEGAVYVSPCDNYEVSRPEARRCENDEH
jgi:threonine dehydratase